MSEKLDMSATDEVDLVELFKTLWQGKWLLLALTLGFFLLAFFYTSYKYKKTTYQAEALVEIGYYTNSGGKKVYFVDLPYLIEKFKAKQFILKNSHVNSENAFIKTFEPLLNINNIDKSELSIFKIISVGKTAESAKEILLQYVNNIVNEHKLIFDKYLERENYRLESIEKEIAFLTENTFQINPKSQGIDIKDATYLAIQNYLKLSEISKLNSLLYEKNLIVEQTQPSHCKNTEILENIIVNEVNENTKKMIIWILGIVSGIFLGSFIILARAQVQREKVKNQPLF